MHIIGLARVSTDAQAKDDRGGLDAQTEGLRAIAKREGATIEIIPVVMSGRKIAKSPAWDKIGQKLQRQDTHIAVLRIDRLERPDGFLLRSLETVSNAGSRIYYEGGHFDLTDAGHRMMATLLIMQAGADADRIRKTTMQGKGTLRAKGRWVQGANHLPTGLTFDRGSGSWGYSDEVWKVREAFDAWLGGERNLSAIARRVGVAQPTVKGWLTNAIYRGIWIFGEADDQRVRVYGGPGQADQLVTDPEWSEVQRTMAKARPKGRKRAPKDTFRWSAMLHSFEALPDGLDTLLEPSSATLRDRHVLWAQSTQGRYICRCGRESAHVEGWHLCGLPQFRADDINPGLALVVEEALASGWAKRTVSNAVADALRVSATLTRRGGEIATQVAALEKKIHKLRGHLADEVVTVEGFRASRDQWQREIDALRDEAASVKAEIEAVGAVSESDQAGAVDRASVREIWISKRGVEAITIEAGDLPGCALPVVAVTLGEQTPGAWSWSTLVGFDVSDPTDRWRVREGLYTIGQAARALGLTVGAIKWRVGAGTFPEPGAKRGRARLWTAEQVDALRRLPGEPAGEQGLVAADDRRARRLGVLES